MEIFYIKNNLEKVSLKQAVKHEYPYVAIADNEEFIKNNDFFDMGIDLELDTVGPTTTKAEVNYDSVIGTFSIPDRNNITEVQHRFVFAFDEKGIVFIGDDGYVKEKIERIAKSKKWRLPSLERFIFDFLEQITDDDLRLLEKYENRLDKLEEMIQKGDVEAVPGEVSAIRSVISDLKLHYGQLLDLTQEFEEDENDFFEEKNLRYFGMYTNRINSLMAITGSIYDHCIQIRELLKATLEAKQNRLMAILTVIATIFMPLTLIAGWYGMNFKFMPELQYKYSYPIVIGVCIVIVISCIYFFKKSKWL